MTQTWRRASKVVVLIVLVTLVPGFACSILGFTSAAGLSGLGAVVGAVATLIGGWRFGLMTSLGIGAATMATVLANDHPSAAFAVFCTLGLLTGILGRRGTWRALIYVPLAAGFVLGERPTVQDRPLLNALVLGLIMGGSALFAAALTGWGARRTPTHALSELSTARARDYGIALGALMGAAAFAVTLLDLGHTGSWIILTIVIVVQPYLQDSLRKSVHRAAGTLLGFAIAIAVAFAVPWPSAIYALASVATVLAILALLGKRPYWVYAVPLTVAVVLFEGAGTSIIDTAEERLAATLIGAGAALLAMAVMAPFARRSAAAQGITHY